MSKLVVLAFVSSSLLLAADPGAQKSKASDQGRADRMILETPVIVMGNEKTVGAEPDTTKFPAVADDDTVGNAKTVGGSRNYTKPVPYSVGKVGNAMTVGNQ